MSDGETAKKQSESDFILLTDCFLVIPERFERSTHALEGRCSIQLSYGTDLMFANAFAKVVLFCCKNNFF